MNNDEKRNVIWIASYPKSGNTWIHSVLRLAGREFGFPQVDLDVYNILRSGALPSTCEAVDGRFKNVPCFVLKTHSAYKNSAPMHQFPGVTSINAAYVHIYRNPLDVLLSYLNFTRIEYKTKVDNVSYRKELFVDMLGFDEPIDFNDWMGMGLDDIPQSNLDHALDHFSRNELTLSTLAVMSKGWAENTLSWLDAAKDLPGHSVRYEDCLEKPETFARFCDLFEFGPEQVLSALDRVNTRARNLSVGGNSDQAIFYNKMKAYYFTEYFSPAAISRFLSRHEDLLKRLGYETIFNVV